MNTDKNKFDGSNTGTYSRYVKPSYAMEIIFILIALGMAIFAGLVFTGKVHAMSGYVRPEGCHTYNVNGVYGGVDNQEAVLCGETSPTLHTAKTAKNDKPSQPVIILPVREVVTDDLPTVITDSTDTDSNVPTDTTVTVKVHCNNGEGNGGEGCSPAKSNNANNDENSTTPKEDKSNK